MPVQTQLASIAAWNDEQHVQNNRVLYRKKFDAVLDILGNALDVKKPDAAFYLWAGTPLDDTQFTRELFRAENSGRLVDVYAIGQVLPANADRVQNLRKNVISAGSLLTKTTRSCLLRALVFAPSHQ